MNTSKEKNIIVTGGAGFIGSHLCGRLLEKGHRVFCVDNFYTGREKNLLPLQARFPKSFELIRHDTARPLDFPAGTDVHEIYQLASPASPPHYQADPIQTIETNVLGTMNLLALAVEKKARLLLASTSEIYGDPLEHPQKESYWGNVNTIGIRSCYDEAKRMSETLAMDYHRARGVDIRIIRIFNTYGPHMRADDGRVVSNFICQAISGKDITIYGEGTQTRSFCYVADLVEGIIRMMENEKNFIGPVNLGNPGEFTVAQLAERVIALTGSKSKIIRQPLPADDPKMRRPDITLAKEKLGWEPTIQLEEGLKKTIPYFKNELGIS